MVAIHSIPENIVKVAIGNPLVMIASDGILESEDAAQQAFGSARLNALLSTFSPEDSAEAVAASILAATDSYASAAPAPHDDRTLLVLRVTDESASDYSKMPIIY